MTKTSRSKAQQSIQPWLRDHYAALRAEAGPRLEQTRAAVVPVLADTTHRVRHDLVPAAGRRAAKVADEARERSAPLRAELSDRAAATLAAARGGVTAEQIGQLQNRRGGRRHRKLWFVTAVTAIGAALGAVGVLWRRERQQDWVEDDAVHSLLDSEDATASNPKPADQPKSQPQPTATAEHDDPADPDGGTDSADNPGDVNGTSANGMNGMSGANTVDDAETDASSGSRRNGH